MDSSKKEKDLKNLFDEKCRLMDNVGNLDRDIMDMIDAVLEENRNIKRENEYLKSRNSFSVNPSTRVSSSHSATSGSNYESFKAEDNQCNDLSLTNDPRDILLKRQCITAKINSMNDLCCGMFQRLKSVALIIKDILKEDDSCIIGDFVSCLDAAKYEISNSLHETSLLLSQGIEVGRNNDLNSVKTENYQLPSLKDVSLDSSILISMKDGNNQDLVKKIDELTKERDYYKEIAESHSNANSTVASNSGSIYDVSEDSSRSDHGKENVKASDDQAYLLLHQVIRLVDNITNYCHKKATEVDITLKSPLKNIEDVSKKAAKKLQQYDKLIVNSKPEGSHHSHHHKHSSPCIVDNSKGGMNKDKKVDENGFTKEIKMKLMNELKGIRETMVYVSEATTEMFSHCQYNKNHPVKK
uniref:Coiled-coil domain-containing protein n=1 Tax=Parastrongyloides trichosuri TaxID=131310 RepID=A0A0N5A4Q6_PARTI